VLFAAITVKPQIPVQNISCQYYLLVNTSLNGCIFKTDLNLKETGHKGSAAMLNTQL